MNKTKRAIFDAAIKEFSINGYSGATMDTIAENAGVAKGTLYYHFKSKEDIFKYIISEGMDLITDQVREAADREDEILQKLRAICRVQLGMVYQNRDFFKVIMSQLWGQEIRHLELRNALRAYIATIEEYLIEAVKQGKIKRGETSFMAYSFFGNLCSAAVYELINNTTDVNEVIDNLMDNILKGIEK